MWAGKQRIGCGILSELSMVCIAFCCSLRQKRRSSGGALVCFHGAWHLHRRYIYTLRVCTYINPLRLLLRLYFVAPRTLVVSQTHKQHNVTQCWEIEDEKCSFSSFVQKRQEQVQKQANR